MRSVPSAGRVDRWSDLESPSVEPVSARVAYARMTAVAVVTLLALAASTSGLTWYGEQSSASAFPGPFDVTWGVSARSPLLSPDSATPWMRPGGQGWGYLILAWSLGVAAAAVIALLIALFAGVEGLGLSLLSLLVAAASIALAVMVELALSARPPYADGPPMILDWGAVIGFILALIASVTASWAFLICAARRRSSRRDQNV